MSVLVLAFFVFADEYVVTPLYLFSAAADVPVNRADSAQVAAMGEPISFVADSANKV